ncbi:paired amphipathic helix protein sin3-like 4 [Nicotiana attenuata]|uniref:Paired amphipathic helix protein sin3-like 4 n=1 Tax=Nicotiana attenuata TaxID=49451 RepID=A0A1J6I708_NICAT|nr:paired amphipathic helix protein sin3-like 4 [Nicotiana attenuata]
MVFPGVEAAANSFIERVKSHPNIYGHYLRVMSGYVTKKLDVSAVVSELETLFQSHEDLLTGYRTFLPRELQETLPSVKPRQSRKRNLVAADMKKLHTCIDFMNKLERRFDDNRGVIRAYLETVKSLKKGKLSNNEVYHTIAKIFGDENQDLVDEFASVLKIKKRKKEEENVSSPSTRSEEIKVERQRTAEEKIIYLQMEEEMSEIDIHLSHVRRTLQSAKALMKILIHSTQQHQIINIVDKFVGDVSRSCIRKEYKEQSFFIIKRLREDPKHVLPHILSKLESKKKELVESKEKLHKRWREAHQQKNNSMLIASRKE